MKHVVLPASSGNGSINSALANDFDLDGHQDIITSYAGDVVILRGPDWKPAVVHRFSAADSKGTKVGKACIHSCLLDVDGDGDQDFVGSNQTVFWLECPKNPLQQSWIFRTIDDEIRGTHCVITGDVNQDGRIDLIANSFRDASKTPFPFSIAWLEIPHNPRDATSWVRHVFAQGDAPGGSHYMGLGDIDKDGRPDISCGAKGGPGFPDGEWFAWWQQPADPTKRWPKHLLATNQPGASNIEPVDLDSDGHMDLIATRGHGRGVTLFRGPHLSQSEVDAHMDAPHCLLVFDLDLDGDKDVATCGHREDGVAAWYENDGKGVFEKHVIGRDQSAYDIRAVDFDNDGDSDLLIAGHFSKNIVWYENPRK